TQITITAKDYNGNPIEGINLTLYPSTTGVLSGQPDPVETDENGMVVLTVSPQASGKLNVTIARNISYKNGSLNWTNAVISDTYITVTGIKTMTLSVSKSPIYQGETLTVTVTYGATPISDVEVTLGAVTVKTGADGIAQFTVPDPGVEYVIMKVIAKKTGYITVTEDVTVLKKWAITITGPSEVNTGATFTVTVVAKGSALAGATVTFQGETKTTDNEGKASFTAPTTEGTYTLTATYENMQSGTFSVVVKATTPGFELITLIIALGVAFILLKRRKK
ncbi:MAG: Ig-like domain-containing protein, partial [Candidatus Thermoplasmatota archaeon]|nr:Ig-like domain-containing protein [Candidatus Thermoplasmatota archaeon]